MGVAALLAICLSTGFVQGPPAGAGQRRDFEDREALETYGDPYMAPKHFVRSPGRRARMGGFTSVQVNVDAFGNNIVGDAANEPSIAVSAADPSRIVIGWRQFDNIASNFRQAGWGYSQNAGASWTFPGVLDPGNFRSDPVLGFDTTGNVYYNSLSVIGNDWHTDTYISSNGGANWGAPNFSYGGDKAWFTIDRSGGSGNGHLYEAWSTAGNNFFPNQFSRSTNGGLNWLNPIQILPQQQVWGTLAVGPNGDLYVSGQDNNSIYVSKSTNAKFPGMSPTFDFTVNVPLGGSFASFTDPNPGGLVGQVWIATDSSNGPTRGNVYVLCSMDPPGSDPLNVYIARSENGGTTWSAPVRVNDDPAGNNAWQWFGTMSVAPNGRIDAVWNDTRNTGQTNLSQTFYSYSLDGGRTWSKNVATTPVWNSFIGWPNQNKIGDYYGMVSDNTGTGLAYSATFNGEQDVYYSRIQPEPPVLPVSFSLFRGRLSSGSLSDLFSSDDSDLVVLPGVVLNAAEAPVQVLLEGTSPLGTALELGFLLESHVSSSNLSQKIELFNFVTGLWEQVDSRAATTSDSIVHAHVTANPGRFIEAGTRRVRARVSYRPTGPVQQVQWTASLDRAHWTIVP